MIGWLLNTTLEKMLKEAIMTYFEVLYQHLSGESEEDHETFVPIASVPVEI